jgi:hypothetical protein
MGIKLIDKSSFSHFIFGFISKLVIFPSNNLLSFIVTQGIHTLIESTEFKYNIYGHMVESDINHVSDMLFFLIGWLIAFKIKLKIKNTALYYSLLTIFVIQVIDEFRDIYDKTTKYKKYYLMIDKITMVLLILLLIITIINYHKYIGYYS